MNITVRLGAVVVLLLLLAACGSSGPTSPTGTNQPPPPTVPSPTPPVTNFPPLSGPSRTFFFDHELSYPSTITRNSRASSFTITARSRCIPEPKRGGVSRSLQGRERRHRVRVAGRELMECDRHPQS